MKYKYVIEGYIDTAIEDEDIQEDQTVEAHIEDAFYSDPVMFFDLADEEDVSIFVEKID